MLFFGSMIFIRNSDNISEEYKPFAALGAIVVSFFGLSQLVFNQFGFDRTGFRALVLSPVPRKYILQGKNFAFLPVSMCIGTLLILLVTFVLRLNVLLFLSAILQMITAFLIICMLGNLASIIAPYRINSGSMKPTKMPILTTLIVIFVSLLFPTTMIPIFIPPLIDLLISKFTSMPLGIFNFIFSVILVSMIALFYWLSLGPLGKLLQSREKKILEVVTREIE